MQPAGRARCDIGFGAWVSLGNKGPDARKTEAEAWRALGVTHLTVNSAFHSPNINHVASPAQTIDEHIALLERYRDAVMT
jgi:hypothetical protein